MDKARKLGRTGIDVGTVGYGAWAIGSHGYGEVADPDAEGAIEAYLDAGGTFIDTARNYNRSEEILGRVLARRGDRDHVFLATKTSMTTAAEQLPLIREQAETSLRLLQTDVIDLYFVHTPPEDPDLMNRVLDEFQTLKNEGKIRAIGASIKGPDVSKDTLSLCRQYVDTGRIDAIQLIYSVLRQLNAQSIAYAEKNGVGIVARTVLESGFLTGKFRKGVQFKGNDHRRRWNKTIDEIVDHVTDLTDWAVRPPYETLAQTALRFALIPPGVSTIIPGGRNAAQVTANMSIRDLPDLTPEIVTRLRSEYGEFTAKANTAPQRS